VTLNPLNPHRKRPPKRDPIRPEAVLECPHEVTCFETNPLAPNIFAGGCQNGQARGVVPGRRGAGGGLGAKTAAAAGGRKELWQVFPHLQRTEAGKTARAVDAVVKAGGGVERAQQNKPPHHPRS
jgi:hypothetical protein